jgi:hypothetical protein
VHDELDRETLKLLEKQHRRRALNLRGCLVRVLVLETPYFAKGFVGELQSFEPDADEIHLACVLGGLTQIAFDQVVDIRAAE